MNVASGFHITMSASQPLASEPLHFSSLGNVAGLLASQFARSVNPKPRLRAAVHVTGSLNSSDAMPPQARKKSPLSSSFNSGGHGEWSETTKSMILLPSAVHK